MTHIEKTQIRFALIFVKIESCKTISELNRLGRIIDWLKYRNIENSSSFSLSYYNLLMSIVCRKRSGIIQAQACNRIANSHKNLKL